MLTLAIFVGYLLGALGTGYFAARFDLAMPGIAAAIWPLFWVAIATTALLIAPIAAVMWVIELGREHGGRK